MHCTEQAQNSPWARSPCLAHGQHFHRPVRLQILLLWGQLHLLLLMFLQWQNTSYKLIGSILPDTTQNSQVSHYLLKKLCATANLAPPSHNSISWKGKCTHSIFRRVHKRKKCLNIYFISKVQSTQQENKNSQNKG